MIKVAEEKTAAVINKALRRAMRRWRSAFKGGDGGLGGGGDTGAAMKVERMRAVSDEGG